MSVVFVVAAVVVFVVDRWIRARRRAAQLRRFRQSAAFRKFEAEQRKVQEIFGTALVGPASRLAEQLRELSERLFGDATAASTPPAEFDVEAAPLDVAHGPVATGVHGPTTGGVDGVVGPVACELGSARGAQTVGGLSNVTDRHGECAVNTQDGIVGCETTPPS